MRISDWSSDVCSSDLKVTATGDDGGALAMDFLEQHKIPLGGWISDFVDFLNTHAAWFFNFISSVLGFLIEGLIDVLQAVPALLLIALLAGFAFWLHRSIWLVVGRSEEHPSELQSLMRISY